MLSIGELSRATAEKLTKVSMPAGPMAAFQDAANSLKSIAESLTRIQVQLDEQTELLASLVQKARETDV